VKDGAGQKLAYVYFEDEPGGDPAAELLSFQHSEGKNRAASGAGRALCSYLASAALRTCQC
jgi:hypothetical protein